MKPDNFPEFQSQDEFESYLAYLKDLVEDKESSEADINMAAEHLKFIAEMLESGTNLQNNMSEAVEKEYNDGAIEMPRNLMPNSEKAGKTRWTNDKMADIKININKEQDVEDFIRNM